MVNRRNTKRRRTNLFVRELDGEYFFLHNVTNLSPEGMYIEPGIPRTPKGEMNFSVLLPNKNEIRFKGRVVHKKDSLEDTGFGIKFLSFEKGHAEDLIDL